MTWGVETLGGIIVILQMAVVVLIAPSLAAGTISSERESGGWPLLQMTPLSSVSPSCGGKLMSRGRTLSLLLVATLPAYVVIFLIDQSQLKSVLEVLATVVLTSVFALFASAAISSLCQRTTAATALSYAVLVSLCGGTMLFWLGQGAPFTQGLVTQVLRFNPLAAALRIIHAPGFRDYELVPFNWYLMVRGLFWRALCFGCRRGGFRGRSKRIRGQGNFSWQQQPGNFGWPPHWWRRWLGEARGG